MSGSPVTFPRLQRGAYVARLYAAPHGTQFESPIVIVSGQPVAVALDETPSRDPFVEWPRQSREP